MEELKDLEETKATWYRKRKWTTGIGIALKCLSFFEYGSISISGLYYYEYSFNVSNPKFFYGSLMSSIFVSSIISTYFCGRYMDKTRDLRKIVIFILICNIIGNLVFTMTYSPWLPILGRFICGISISAETAVSGETILTSIFNLMEARKCKCHEFLNS